MNGGENDLDASSIWTDKNKVELLLEKNKNKICFGHPKNKNERKNQVVEESRMFFHIMFFSIYREEGMLINLKMKFWQLRKIRNPTTNKTNKYYGKGWE